MSQRVARDLTAQVAERLGVRVVDGHTEAVGAVVHDGMRRHSIGDPAGYRDLIARDPAAFGEIVAALTNGETYFFRHPDQWRLLRDRVLPEVLDTRPGGTRVHLWSAGCASGEEPYTLAIVLDELGVGHRARILASDVSPDAVAAARSAVYTGWSLRSPEARARQARFRVIGGRYRLERQLVERVELTEVNLVRDPYPVAPGGLDLILCRNVLLHMTAHDAARVAARLVAALRPGGWLLTSAADPPLTGPGGLDAPGLDASVSPGTGTYRRAAAPHGKRGQPAARPAGRDRRLARDRLEPNGRARSDQRGQPAGTPRAAHDHRTSPPACPPPPPRDAAARLEQACALLHEGRSEPALTAATAAAFLDPGLAAAQVILGLAARALDEKGVAARAFRRAGVLLAQLPADAEVPLLHGERAGRLRALAEDHARLLGAHGRVRA